MYIQVKIQKTELFIFINISFGVKPGSIELIFKIVL